MQPNKCFKKEEENALEQGSASILGI